jgi:hypothetical protein
MRMRWWLLVGAGLALTAAAGCSRDVPTRPEDLAIHAAGGSVPPARVVAPTFDSTAFRSPRPNPFFPLVPGTVNHYAGRADSDSVTSATTVTDRTKRILGVDAVVVTDQVFHGGPLIEDTIDWFAADNAGNVWYMGEATREFRNGMVVSTLGSWEAGVNGAQPGIIMPAQPRMGDRYQQEFQAGVVEDMAAVFAVDRTVSVPAGKFTGVLGTVEWSPLEPGVRETKSYAPNVGVVLEEAVSGETGRLELQSITIGNGPPRPGGR